MELFEKVFCKEKLTPWQELDDKALVLTPQKSAVHELNETATWIWKQLDGEKTLNQIMFEMCEEFEASAEQLQKDILALISEMSEKGLVIERK